MTRRSDFADSIIAILADRPIAYHPGFALAFTKINRYCGVKEAIFISQMLYWDGKGARGDGWIWKKREEWRLETGLSFNEQKTVREHLVEIGVLEEKLMGMPGKLHFRLNRPRLRLVAELSYDDEEEERGILEELGLAPPEDIDRGKHGRFVEFPDDRSTVNQVTGVPSASTPEYGQHSDRNTVDMVTEDRSGSEITTEITPESTSETTLEGWSVRDLQDYLQEPEQGEPETDGSFRIDLEEDDVELQCPACKETHPLPSKRTKFTCPECEARLSGYLGGVLIYKPASPPKNKQKQPDPVLQLASVVGDRCPVDAHRVCCSSPEQADEVRKAYRSNPDHFLWWIGMVMQWQIRDRKYRWEELVQVILDRFYQKEAENNQGKETRIDVQEAARNAVRNYSVGGPLAAYFDELERDSGNAAPELRDPE